MAASLGARLGPYEILGPLGAGGMGEVYRARDSRLDRTVAIKILPAHVATDPVRRKRFEREARAIATLTHPNICALHDVGHYDGIEFLVLEHLEGITLEERLKRGPLPIDQALRYGIELTDALDHAHRRGIVHRDVKPANIVLTRTGVKLLDFGLAHWPDRDFLAIDGGPQGDTVSLTAEGTIVGTRQYMAPEQIEGMAVDHRADLFALGAVLYEMTTGNRAFKGESAASQIAAILTFDPPPVSASALDRAVPPAFDHVVQRCLAKDPDERWQHARDVGFELGWIASRGSHADAGARRGSDRWNVRLAWIATGVLAAIGITLAAAMMSKRPPSPGEPTAPVRFTIGPPENGAFSPNVFMMAVSPDGRRLAFVASPAGGPRFLWIRPLDSTSAHVLPGTENAEAPFWSPDGRSLGFVADSTLKRIDLEGERISVLAEHVDSYPGVWSPEGIILFWGLHEGFISQVPSQGGPVTAATALDPARHEVAHVTSSFLPDGHHFLFVGDGMDNALFVGSVESTTRVRVMTVEDFDTRFVEPGYLMWHRGNTVVAQRFDPATLRVSGQPVPIAQQVRYHAGTDYGIYSTSMTGVLAYRSVPTTRLTWFDRRGASIGSIGPAGSYLDPAISPDGTRLAVSQLDPERGTRDIWLYDIRLGTWSRLSFNPADETLPVWSPDGTQIVFASTRRSGFYDLFVRSLGNGAADRLLESTPPHKWPVDWSAASDLILYRNAMTGALWLLRPGRAPMQAQTVNAGLGDRLSPDGRWLAFSRAAVREGEPDVYVTPFPAGEPAWRVSEGGGVQPRWRQDGREIFYLASDGRLMAVPVDPAGGFHSAPAQPLFQTRLIFPEGATELRKQYDVTPDGQRFLLNEPAGDNPITIVLNWPSALRQ